MGMGIPMGMGLEWESDFPCGDPLGIPTWGYPYGSPCGDPKVAVGMGIPMGIPMPWVWESDFPCGDIHMRIPTKILWEWKWKFSSHGNPGGISAL